MSSALKSYQALNDQFFEALSTPGMEKLALDAVSEFTRTRVREAGFFRRVIPMVKVENDDLDRQADTDLPVIVVDKEPDSPAAVTIPFGALPSSTYIQGPRYRVTFNRLATTRFQKDIDELRTWKMDIRQILSDNSIKDMLAHEDARFLTAVNTSLGGAADTLVPQSGVIQWETIFGGMSRDSVIEAFKIMGKTPSHLEPNTVLINNTTARELTKWGFDEAGGSQSGDWLQKGWSEGQWLGATWITTIKRHLVPDDCLMFFADPRFVGKSFVLEDTVMHVKREAFMIQWFSYECIGGAIAHTGGLARADFA